jgi:hypothetical protein
MDVTEKTPEQVAEELSQQIARTINTLERGLLRARYITGWRLRRTDETPALPGPSRARLGDLLDAIHNLPQYLRELTGRSEPMLPPRSVEGAFRAFDFIMRDTKKDME